MLCWAALARALSCMRHSFRARLVAFIMQPKCIFSIPFLFTKNACYQVLQFCIIFAYYFALRAHATTNFSAANRNQYSSAFTKPKALSYFYHHTTNHSPTLQKTFTITPSSGTPHTLVIAATAPCCHTHIMSTMGAIQFARFVQQPFCSLACRIIFCKNA